MSDQQPSLEVGTSYTVTYRDHHGRTVVGRRLTFRGRRDSEDARQFYPGSPGIAVPMLDWEQVGDPVRLAFRAMDLIAVEPIQLT